MTMKPKELTWVYWQEASGTWLARMEHFDVMVQAPDLEQLHERVGKIMASYSTYVRKEDFTGEFAE